MLQTSTLNHTHIKMCIDFCDRLKIISTRDDLEEEKQINKEKNQAGSILKAEMCSVVN